MHDTVLKCLQLWSHEEADAVEELNGTLPKGSDEEEHDEEITCVFVSPVLLLSVSQLRRETRAGAEDAIRS